MTIVHIDVDVDVEVDSWCFGRDIKQSKTHADYFLGRERFSTCALQVTLSGGASMESSSKAQNALNILQRSLGLLVQKCGGNGTFVCVTTATISGAVCLYAGWRLRSRYFSGETEKISAAEACLELSLWKRGGSGTFSRCESIVSTASGSDIGGPMRDTYRLALVVRSDLGMVSVNPCGCRLK